MDLLAVCLLVVPVVWEHRKEKVVLWQCIVGRVEVGQLEWDQIPTTPLMNKAKHCWLIYQKVERVLGFWLRRRWGWQQVKWQRSFLVLVGHISDVLPISKFISKSYLVFLYFWVWWSLVVFWKVAPLKGLFKGHFL